MFEETQDSSSSKKERPRSRREKKVLVKSFPEKIKENANKNQDNKEKLLETPFAPSRISNLVSTAASSIDFELLSPRNGLREQHKEGAKRKVDKRSKRENNANFSNRKAMKKNEGGKKVFRSYLTLVDRKTKKSEQFRLYKDKEIGFEGALQVTIKEAVRL